MKQIKICLYCGNEFETSENAKKYCRVRCALNAAKKRAKSEDIFLCQWCGQTFNTKRSVIKFCSSYCRNKYMSKIAIFRKKVVKIPIKITIEDAVKCSKQQKLTYGRYVSINNL